jgi:formamidopyrimidine-DNA glycosylase
MYNGWVPELPEVEAARALIADTALRRSILDVDDSDTFVCRPHAPGELRDALVGRMLTTARRRGKSIWCETSGTARSATPGPVLGIHLGMTGRLIVVSASGEVFEGGDPPPRRSRRPGLGFIRFALRFADGGSLALSDRRRLGRVRLDPDIDALGPDAGEVTRAEFRGLITKGTIAVKARLLDQSKIAGIGNLLADEALWQAKISPAASVRSLRPADADRLYCAVKSVVASAVSDGGAHTGDMIEYRHAGARCPRCGAEMRHGTVGGRTTWWCSREQKPRR